MEKIVEKVIDDEGQVLLGWRDVPVDNSCLSKAPEIVATEPVHRQVFIGRGRRRRRRGGLRAQALHRPQGHLGPHLRPIGGLQNDFYIVSMSCRTLVYKGMFLAYQLARLLPRPARPAISSRRSRSSTSASRPTPSRRWRLAHPYRFVCHNGEINTVRGNVNWMAARQATRRSPTCSATTSRSSGRSPIEGQSDTACFDNALEFLIRGGYSLPHAAMMLIPEAWAGNPLMDEDRRAFYEYHAALMEPWDGPAAMAFSDGKYIGATLDRNGLRPARYIVTADDEVIMASEAGVLPIEESDRQEVAPAAGQDAAHRPRGGPHHLRRRDQGRAVAKPPLPEVAGAHPDRARGPARRCRRRRAATDVSACSIASRPSATPRKT